MDCHPSIRDDHAACSCGWRGPSRDGDLDACEHDIAVHLGHTLEVAR